MFSANYYPLAPQPRKKDGRAARLYAIEQAKSNGSASDVSDSGAFRDASPVNFEASVDPTDDGEDTEMVNGVV